MSTTRTTISIKDAVFLHCISWTACASPFHIIFVRTFWYVWTTSKNVIFSKLFKHRNALLRRGFKFIRVRIWLSDGAQWAAHSQWENDWESVSQSQRGFEVSVWNPFYESLPFGPKIIIVVATTLVHVVTDRWSAVSLDSMPGASLAFVCFASLPNIHTWQTFPLTKYGMLRCTTYAIESVRNCP